ncbi:hypothetical protein [Maribacter sp. 2308TA10-17]|uniref:hypothetical protein n=1 Tax=Maribacter sp. 2308TA10-17 TaxID=3386276 RepID=UPI0039BD0E52
MKIYVIIAFYLISISASAQIQQTNNGSLNELVYYVGTNTKKYDDEAEGLRYLTEQFTPATINGITETQLVRFNVVENTIEIKDENNKVLTLSQSYDYTVKLLDGSNKTYETHSFIDENGNKSITFFEKLYGNENFRLYLKERIIYIPAKKSTSSYEQDVPGKFKKGNTIFHITDFISNSSILIEVPKKGKKLAILFKDQAKYMEKFIKHEKLKTDQKEDLIKIFNSYFNLQ